MSSLSEKSTEKRNPTAFGLHRRKKTVVDMISLLDHRLHQIQLLTKEGKLDSISL